MLMTLTACGIIGQTQKITSSSCPKPLIPNIEVREVLKISNPDFYIKFTNQQLALRSCYVPLKISDNLTK